MKRSLNRRTLLRGMLAGSAVAVGLPTLELFLNGNGDALASGGGFPQRFGWWFWGNGVHGDLWVPEGTGEQWKLSPELLPLESVKDDITVVSGLKVYTPNEVPHGTGPAGILTGGRLGVAGGDFDNSTFGAASLDQLIANEIGSATRYRSIEVAVQRSNDSLSFTGPGQSNPPEYSPKALFSRIFGAGFVAPGEDPIIDPKLALRRSVLDAVGEDAKQLKKQLGASDRQRIDQHFASVRTLERQIAKLEEDPPNLASCQRPEAPLDDYPDIEGRPQLSEVSRVMSDLLALAMACDLTRVFSFQFSRPVSNLLFPGASAGHHQLTHDELGDQPQVQAIVRQIVSEFAYFVEALRKIPEGDETLLDHSVTLGFTDCSFGKSHAVDEYPLLLAGSACGALRRGYHYRSPAAENASKLGFTLLRTMGVATTEFGSDEGYVTEGLDDIEA